MPNDKAFNWGGDESWGSKFWVTLVDPRVKSNIYQYQFSHFYSFFPSQMWSFTLALEREQFLGTNQSVISYYLHLKKGSGGSCRQNRTMD
jgi:hypothetical protein